MPVVFGTGPDVSAGADKDSDALPDVAGSVSAYARAPTDNVRPTTNDAPMARSPNRYLAFMVVILFVTRDNTALEL